MKRLIVVDLSSFIFRAFYAIRPLHSPEGVPVNAVHGVLSMLMKLFSQYQPTHIFIARDTSGGTFRNELYPQYKANRSEPPEDLIPQFELIRNLVTKMNLPALAHDNFEADDIIGSACVQWKDYFDEILIASGDKDLMQFVDDKIKLLDTMKDKKYDPPAVFEKMGVYPEQIVDYLSMVGDASDNIPGMRGIGAKGAAKLLAEHETLEKCIEVKDTFKGKKLTTAFSEHLDEGLLSKSLIKIVTDVDLESTPEDTQYKFYPTDDLIEYLRTLGFKSMLKKLEDLKFAEHQADNADPTSFGGSITPDKPALKYHLLEEQKVIDGLDELLDSSEVISLHTEYDSQDIINRTLSGIAVSPDGENIYYLNKRNKTWDKFSKEILSRVWGDENLIVVGEHWKRDFFYSYIQNIEIKCKHYDIVQAHYVADPEAKHELQNIAQGYIGWAPVKLEKGQSFLSDLEEELVEAFLGERASACFLTYEVLKKEIHDKELEDILERFDHALIPVLSELEMNGIKLESEFFFDLEKVMDKKLNAIEKKIADYLDGETINLNSPKQVSELLFDKLGLPVVKKTKTGFSTDSEVLETLDAKNINPVPGMILQYRELGKLLSTYIRTLPKLVHPKTGRIHTHFNQHVAATGRLSSNNPNLQNIPIRTEMGRKLREGFVAEKGHVLLGADYSQVELRLLAHFSQDPTMLKAFKNNQDIHRQTASEIMGIPLDEVSSEERSKAKAVNFGLMYGQSSFGLAKQIRVSRTEAKDYITSYFQKFSKVKAFLDGLKEEAEHSGYAKTLFNRKRFLPDIHSKNRTVKSMAERVAINSPIQGTAADILKLAMINIFNEMKEKNLKSKMLLQVHDELIFEVPEAELEEMKKLVKNGMENVVELSVPLNVEMGTGTNWFDLK
ncbi:DNA polymerase I [Bacteriovoracaceae bacterium]|nr:DNA polymerase I [Bacteriovoracaceae bacterium]